MRNDRGQLTVYVSLVSSLLICFLDITVVQGESLSTHAMDDVVLEYFQTYCFDCHDEESMKGNLDLVNLLSKDGADLELVFENLITFKMPPPKKDQPKEEDRQEMLQWLAQHQMVNQPNAYRRISRHEFVQSANDLLGIELDLTGWMPEDRGTYDFDSDRRIQVTQEMLGAYFNAVDDMLEFAFPAAGFLPERIWITNRIKDSHKTYNIYTRPYKDGILFSWTRANNGNSYSFFYDGFEPPIKGWYDLTFDAMKLGGFPEDVSLMVFAGKYYYADDRPQPQRLLDVISLDDGGLKSHSIRVFLHPGENVSVHCYSKHNFRQRDGQEGAYIKQLKVSGPIYEQWPPRSYRQVFAGLPIKAALREPETATLSRTKLQAIGGRISVSSYQEGMEMEKMQDGSNRTFWHTRFSPTLAEPPHFVILENPNRETIEGLSYSTWSGGNSNGQVESYAIFVSDDGQSWGDPIKTGDLEIRLANQQSIPFPQATNKRFIKFLVVEAYSIDGRSLASIGKLDVMTDVSSSDVLLPVAVSTDSAVNLKNVIKRFAEHAFCTNLTDEELELYYHVGLECLKEQGDFVAAARLGMKSVLASHRFILVPGEHANSSYRYASTLARILWLSVPDANLMELAKADQLHGKTLEEQIERMIQDSKIERMIHSLCYQWLNLRAFKKISPSLKLYPLYDDLLNRYLPIETKMYLTHLIRENLPVGHLIDSDYSFLNQRLAQHYGVEGVIGQQMRKVSFDSQVPRGGLLTMGSVLKVTASGFDTSPILRGAWISKNIVGNTLSPPPENVKAIESMPGEEAINLKEQIDQHKSNPACYSCHKSIDPYGFALESFDATGQWRRHYRVIQPHNGTFQYRPQGYFRTAEAVDASGEIGGQSFTDIFELKKFLISDHKKIAYNFIKKFFEYANGYRPSLNQRLDLFAMIPSEPEACRLKDMITQTLIYSLREPRE